MGSESIVEMKKKNKTIKAQTWLIWGRNLKNNCFHKYRKPQKQFKKLIRNESMLIALSWEHEGPTDTFMRRRKELLRSLTEGPPPCSLTIVSVSTTQGQHQGLGKREAQGAARSSILALWAEGGSMYPGQCPSISSTLNLTTPTQKSPLCRGPGGGPCGDIGFCVCTALCHCPTITTVKGCSLGQR